ncbi:MAG: hypothetical protein AAB152_18795 [Candidatus Coatesbacteria bacterium]
MTEAEARETAKTLMLMAASELAVGRLYMACAKADDDRREVWERIAGAERNHAKWIEAMAGMLLARNGEGFRIGRKFEPKAVEAFTDEVRKNEADVQTGAIKGRVMYMIARGIEAALLEDRFFEFVATEDEEYKKLVTRIVTETRQHQTLMQAWVKAAGA